LLEIYPGRGRPNSLRTRRPAPDSEPPQFLNNFPNLIDIGPGEEGRFIDDSFLDDAPFLTTPLFCPLPRSFLDDAPF